MKNIKKLVGFPIGVMMLAISYIAVYLIYGNTAYQSYLFDLTNANVLVNQVLCAGVYYLSFTLLVKNLIEVINKKEKANWNDFMKIFSLVILTGAIGVCIDKFASFKGETLVDILLGSSFVALIIGYIIHLVTNVINVHKINKSLKNRNK